MGLPPGVEKLKPGKSSPDGITAEILKALPAVVLQGLALDMERRIKALDFPQEWFVCAAALVAKVVGATDLSKFRPIACLCTMRKILGYMFLSALPPLTFMSSQTAFVKGSHANMGPHLILRLAELTREWRLSFCVAQLDLRKAFDHIDHRAAFRAMSLQGISLHAQALMAKIWSLSAIKAKLGTETSEAVPLHRGLPQGAPESPLIFTMIVEMIVRTLEVSWHARGMGFRIDGLIFCCVCYADDIVLLAHTPQALTTMIAETIAAFNAIGLGVGAEKTHWTSTPPREGAAINVEGHEVKWEPNLTFVGIVLDLTGSSWAAIRHRMSQAICVLRRWSPLLYVSWLSGKKKVALLSASVFSSVLWGCAVWTPTKAMRTALDSWSARIVTSVLGLRRHPVEPVGDWWRRMHRFGHAALRKLGQPLSATSRTILHRWSGHLARFECDHFLSAAVRCRSVQWWRWRQSVHTCKHSGPHPQRFKAWRWEDQLCRVHGDGFSEDTHANSGWLRLAQDRTGWREAEANFVACQA